MAVVGVLTSLLALLVPVVLAVVVVRQVAARRTGGGDGHGVRRFFQYLLLLALTIVVATGLAGLLAEPVRDRALVDTGGALARAIVFVVVGGPILAVLVVWTRRQAVRDAGELAGLGWAAYVTLAQLVAVAVAAVALHDVVRAALVEGRPDAVAAVELVVWGSLAAGLHVLDVRTLDEPRRRPLLLLGALAGWVLGVLGLVALLSAALEALVVPAPSVIVGARSPLGAATALLVAGAPVWLWYWRHRLARTAVDGWWLAYVLPVGVGASLVMAVVGASIVVDRVLVRTLGHSTGTTAEFLAGTAVAVAVGAVGALSWWYHRQVMTLRGPAERTELTRVMEYLLAGIALLAATVGVALAVVALLEAVAPTAPVLVGGPSVDRVLAAVTLLLVGGPLWWWFWSRIRHARDADPGREVASPARRAYLVVLFGVAGLVSVAVVLVAAFLVVDDLLAGDVGAGTVADVRVPLGVLAASATVSAYHWAVQREDRRVRPAAPVRTGPERVLLVGPRDDALVAALRRATGARVELWETAGDAAAGGAAAWHAPGVLDELGAAAAPRVVVVWRPEGALVVGARSNPAPGARPVRGSAPGAQQDRDEPRPGGEQREPELGHHAEAGGLESDDG